MKLVGVFETSVATYKLTRTETQNLELFLCETSRNQLAGCSATDCEQRLHYVVVRRPKDHSDIEVSIPDAAARCSQVVATPEGTFPSHNTIQTSHM